MDKQVDCLLNCPRSYAARGFILWVALRQPIGLQDWPHLYQDPPPPPPSPAGPKAWGCQEGWGRRLAALLLTAPSSLSQNSLSSLPTASPSHPQLLHFQKRTIEASGGQHEIMYLKSPACGWHIVGTKEAKHCGIGYYHHSHLTDGKAEAQIVRTVSWPLNPAV